MKSKWHWREYYYYIIVGYLHSTNVEPYILNEGEYARREGRGVVRVEIKTKYESSNAQQPDN